MDNKTGYGPHLTCDLEMCNFDKIADLENVRNFLNSVPESIGMVKISDGEPFWYRPEPVMDHGITGMDFIVGKTIIATSHISIHTYPYIRYAFIDIFSCKPFDTELAIDIIRQFFEPEVVDHDVKWRGKNFHVYA